MLIDAEGNLTNSAALGPVLSDPDAYPWRTMSAAELPTDPSLSLLKPDGTTASAADLKGKKIGLYFSAHWCAPCRAFTPALAETYLELKGQGRDFEVIFVSSDKSQSQFDEYVSHTNNANTNTIKPINSSSGNRSSNRSSNNDGNDNNNNNNDDDSTNHHHHTPHPHHTPHYSGTVQRRPCPGSRYPSIVLPGQSCR